MLFFAGSPLFQGSEPQNAIELNANPQRLDLSARWLAMAKERGVLVSVKGRRAPGAVARK